MHARGVSQDTECIKQYSSRISYRFTHDGTRQIMTEHARTDRPSNLQAKGNVYILPKNALS